MRGVVEIDFIVSVFVFISTIAFVTFLVVGNLPIFHTTATADSLKSRAYQYSEMLFFDEGYPKNWSLAQEPFGNVKRIGLSSGERYIIDFNKLQRLETLCNNPLVNYTTIKNRLALDYTHDVFIEASYMNSSPVFGNLTICGLQARTQARQQFQITRLGVLNTDKSIIKLNVIIVS